jgi:hypothetical protein
MAKLERFDKDCYRIVEGGSVVAFAIRLSNDRWRLSDVDDFPLLGNRSFDKPKDVLAAWQALKGGSG